jgi:Leucine-rich repeat (LRR) protein
MRSKGINELLVNYARGFEGKDLSFLTSLPELAVFWIIHRTIDDISPIHGLHELRSLKVDTYCDTPIDFSQFPQLQHCYIEWRKNVSSLFDRPHLKELFINKYDKKVTDAFASLHQLEQLSLANASVEELGGLAGLAHLWFLGLYRARRLSSLRGIESLSTLTTLEIQDCTRIDSLEEISELTNLRRLLFTDVGTVRSIRFVDGLRNLEEVLFYGSTNVEDGDLSPLTRLPNLKNLAFQNRRHYSHKQDDFEQH